MLIERLPWTEQPTDIVTPSARWLARGLTAAYLLQPHLWTINMVTGQIGGTHIGTGISFVGGKLRTPGTSGNGALLDHGLPINIAAPISMVVGCEHVSGSTDWGLLRNTANWYGWYSDTTGAIKTANNNVFNGALTLGGNGSVAFRHTSNADLTGAAGANLVTDATTTLPTTVDRTQIVLGYSRRSVSDAPAVADFTHFYVFQAALSDAELVELANEPWRLWEERRGVIPVSVASVTIYRPNSDVSVSGWTPSTGATVYGVIDETTLDDADYATSPDLSSASPATMGLTASLAAGNWTVRVRGLKTDTVGQLRINLLDSSNVVQGSSSWQALTGTYATYSLSVTTTGTATRVQIEVST
ncbi:MAG TPA: hypothetical protein PK441_01200 [Burkholderiaceae bacterium]|nr:hypothetical protein [Burkholderiaceae bacterium]